jgi:hypothetical protein
LDVGLTSTVTSRLDVAVSTRLATAGYTAPDNVSIAAIDAKTTNLPPSPAAVGSAMTLTSGERDAVVATLLDLADAIETGITPRKALRAIAAVAVGLIPSGAGTATEAFKGIGQASGGTTRVINTVDENGNRTGQTLNL